MDLSQLSDEQLQALSQPNPDLSKFSDDQLSALANHGQPQPQQMNSDLGSQAGAGLLAFGQGGMPVFDELGAAAGAGIQKYGDGIGKYIPGYHDLPESETGGTYDQRLANIRGTEQAFHKENPKLDTGLRLSGGVAATIPFSASLAASPILGGAAYGTAQGFAGGNDGVGSRIINGGIGAALGGAGGAVAKYVLPAIANNDVVKQFIKSESSGGIGSGYNGALSDIINPSAKTLNDITEKLALSGIKPEDYAKALQASTPEDFAAELGGDPLRLQAATLAKVPSEGMQTARDAMKERIATAPQRTKNILAQALGSEDNIGDNLATLEQYRTVEPDLYKAVQGNIGKSQFADVIDTPAGQKALQQAAVDLANRKINPITAGFTQGKDGLYSLSDNVPLSTWHQIGKSLGSQIPKDAFGNEISDASTAPIMGLRKDIVGQLKRLNPDFQLAQDVAAQARQGEQAFSNGRAAARMMAGEKADNVIGNLEQNPFGVSGYHQGLLDTISQAPLGGGNPAGMIAKQSLIDRVGQLTGDEAKAKQLADALMQEKARIDFANRGLNNSSTVETLANSKPDIPLTPHGFLGKAMDKLHSLLPDNNNNYAQLMYATSPEQKKVLANALVNGHTYYPQGDISPITKQLLGMAPAIPAQIMGSERNIPHITITPRSQ